MKFGLTFKKAVAATLAPALFASVAFFTAPSQAETPTEGPALWKLSDEDSNIYLFGTVHILKPTTKWRTDKINKAYSSSEKVYFEADTDSLTPQEQQALITPLALNPSGVKLSSRVSPLALELLKKEAAAFGIPVSALEPYRPWFVTLNLSVQQMLQAGYNPASGVEQVILADAKRDNKELAYLETPEFQINLLASLGGEDEDKFFEDGMKEFSKGKEILDQMVQHWAEGNPQELAEVMNKSMEAAPKLKKVILDDRNADWAEQIDAMMKGSGDIFIAVGSGHLAGKNSVQELLEAKGYKVVRQ